ncbi:hypothetical protein CcaverHIS002_0210920 [Cutaneotrichosporon cavernicola]|nr:hypothetical protein CcaverHIS002_0210920 [Cutaneotrichosporon cavernicola]
MEEAHIDLEPGSEWRFELEADENIAVRVHSPDPVYINGEEFPPTTWYPLYRYTKGAIYAPTAARIEVTSLPASQYTSTSTIQPHLHSLHLALERLRILARRGNAHGPRVMVLGPPSSGKTTVAKCLVNMALGTGLGWNVSVAGLDPNSPANLIPGTLSLSTPNHPLPSHHLAHPFGGPPASLPSNTQSADVPTLGWWYGALEPSSRGTPIWHKLVTSMAEAWRARCTEDPNVSHSGLFIDAPSAFANPATGQTKEDRSRYPLLRAAVEAFDVDLVLVIGLEKLTIESGTTFMANHPLPPELSGLLGRTTPLGLQLSPHSFQIGWDALHVLRVGEGSAAPSSALPLGSSHILSPTRLTRVDPGGPAHVVRLLNTVLAIVAITPEDRVDKAEIKVEVKEEEGEDVPDAVAGAVDLEEDEVPFREEIGWREVLGFVVITAIDTQRKKYTILSPSPGRLPSTIALAGHGIEWVDSA